MGGINRLKLPIFQFLKNQDFLENLQFKHYSIFINLIVVRELTHLRYTFKWTKNLKLTEIDYKDRDDLKRKIEKRMKKRN